MEIDAFLEAAWADHADQPRAVAARLPGALSLVQTAEHIAPYARLVTHVYGEHLGEWAEGVALLASLRAVPAFDGSPAAASVVARSIAALRHAGGERDALAGLPGDEQIAALAVASAAFTGQQAWARASAALADATQRAEAGLPDGSPALRALAIAANNLAAALEKKADRDSAESSGMVAAAETALRYWTQAGTWLEEERAHDRLARSLLEAGQAEAAIRSAGQCIAVCARNDAPAFERFFGYAALAMAQRQAGNHDAFGAARARALELYEQVAQDERQWCDADRAALGS